MEHTPGPWEAREYDVLSPKDKKGERIVVAEALSSGDSGRANAKLMAASPDMLEALKPLVEYVASPEAHYNGPHDSIADIIKAAVAAIDAAS